MGSGLRQVRMDPDPPWADPVTPAGSLFTAAQWAEARLNLDLGHGRRGVLIEVRNQGEGALMIVPVRKEPVVRTVYLDRHSPPQHVVEPLALADVWGALHPLVADVLDGCLLLTPLAHTSHPAAVSGQFEYRQDGETTLFRIVRPIEHQETRSWCCGANVNFDSDKPDQSRGMRQSGG